MLTPQQPHHRLSGCPTPLGAGALIAAIGSLACSGGVAAPGGTGITLTVAPLTLPGVSYVCYDVQISGPGGTVVSLGDPSESYLDGDSQTICSWQYGNGAGGDISYVAPCDADDGDGQSPAEATNTVTIWFDGLYRDSDDDHDPDEDVDIGQWQNPCPDGCSLPVVCRENRDTEVVFNFTVMREANQGFFDIGVNFDDIFCSAKLDCQDALLHDPATGERGPTAVLGFACTSGQDADGTPQDTYLYLDDVRIECTNPAHTYTFDATDGPGQVGGQDPGIFQAAFYRGHEDLPGLDKCYWNAAFGLDVETLADPAVLEGDCWLRARGTASQVAFSDGNTPANTMYPVIEWNVQLTGADGGLICGDNPLNGSGSGVQTTYTDFAGEAFGCSMQCGTGEIECGGAFACTGTVPSIPGAVTVSQAGDVVTINFQGHDLVLPIDPAYTVAGCCADTCCTEEVSR